MSLDGDARFIQSWVCEHTVIHGFEEYISRLKAPAVSLTCTSGAQRAHLHNKPNCCFRNGLIGLEVNHIDIYILHGLKAFILTKINQGLCVPAADGIKATNKAVLTAKLFLTDINKVILVTPSSTTVSVSVPASVSCLFRRPKGQIKSRLGHRVPPKKSALSHYINTQQE